MASLLTLICITTFETLNQQRGKYRGTTAKTKGLMLFHVLAMVSLLKDVWVGLLRGVVAHSWARAGEWSVPFGGGSSAARWANEEYTHVSGGGFVWSKSGFQA